MRLYAIIGATLAVFGVLAAVWALASSRTEARILKEIAERRINDIQNDREADEEVSNLTDDELRDRANEWLRNAE